MRHGVPMERSKYVNNDQVLRKVSKTVLYDCKGFRLDWLIVVMTKHSCRQIRRRDINFLESHQIFRSIVCTIMQRNEVRWVIYNAKFSSLSRNSLVLSSGKPITMDEIVRMQ